MGESRDIRGPERGQALPLFLLAFVTVVAFAGLAIDGARLYAERERLQGAADAAAVGAAHELRRGNRDYARTLLAAATHDAGLYGVSTNEAEIVVHHPPLSGAFANSGRHVEVVVRTDMSTTFMAMFGVGKQAVRGRAVAGVVAADAPCLVALAEGADAYVIEGAQPFEPHCSFEAGKAADPFVDLRMPTCAGRSPGSIQRSADGAETLYWPGCYDQPVEIGAGRSQLMPGVHIYPRGLRIEGGEVSGAGVTLLFPASEEQGGVSIGPQARVRLEAAKTGEFPGMLIFSEAGGRAAEAVIARGEGSELEGAIYVPGRTLRWAPNAPGSTSWTQAVAGRLVILEPPDGRAVLAPPADAASATLVALAE